MTIKEFAKLCECNPQTLRYYDSIDLLKPVKVDEWSGYRYYDKEQAIDYVKIKNLQKAGFTIDEIKNLVTQDDATVFNAFETKVREAEARLAEIKEIRQSYQSEMNTIKNKLTDIKNKILEEIRNYNPEEEFGISKDKCKELADGVEQFMKEALDSVDDMPSMIPNGKIDKFLNDEPVKPEKPEFVGNATYKVVMEKEGWANVKEFLPELETLEPGTYGLDFVLTEDKYKTRTAFSSLITNMLVSSNTGSGKTISCGVNESEDGKNHFKLYKKVI